MQHEQFTEHVGGESAIVARPAHRLRPCRTDLASTLARFQLGRSSVCRFEVELGLAFLASVAAS
eukprot:15434195-Alexandrium_andersonii.AAC.1